MTKSCLSVKYVLSTASLTPHDLRWWNLVVYGVRFFLCRIRTNDSRADRETRWGLYYSFRHNLNQWERLQWTCQGRKPVMSLSHPLKFPIRRSNTGGTGSNAWTLPRLPTNFNMCKDTAPIFAPISKHVIPGLTHNSKPKCSSLSYSPKAIMHLSRCIWGLSNSFWPLLSWYHLNSGWCHPLRASQWYIRRGLIPPIGAPAKQSSLKAIL